MPDLLDQPPALIAGEPTPDEIAERGLWADAALRDS
jgi:hypothetical protein